MSRLLLLFYTNQMVVLLLLLFLLLILLTFLLPGWQNVREENNSTYVLFFCHLYIISSRFYSKQPYNSAGCDVEGLW